MPAWSAPRLAPPESTNAVMGWALVAKTAAAAATAGRLGGHLVAGGRHRVPAGAEGVHALAAGVTGALVAGEGVERVAVVGHLRLAVGAGGAAQLRGAGPGAGHRLAAYPERRPRARACSGARALGARVLLEQVERVALRVVEDLAEAAVLDTDSGRLS